MWVLNQTAAFIWEQLGTGIELSQVKADFRTLFSISQQRAETDIDTALAGFAAEGLLAGGNPQKSVSPLISLGDFVVAAPPLDDQTLTHDSLFMFSGHGFSLAANNPMVIATFIGQMGSLSTPLRVDELVETRIAVVRTTEKVNFWTIYVNGQACHCGLQWDAVFPALMTLIFVRTLETLQQSCIFHAAVLLYNNQGLLLPGQAGSGKTTLTAALAQRGWLCFSDEMAVINQQTLQLTPMLMPMSIKAGSVQPLADDYPELSNLPVWQRADEKRVRYLLPPEQSLPAKYQSAAVNKIVFPVFHSSGETSLTRADKLTALQRLSVCGSSNRALQQADVQVMIDLVDGADCYELFYVDNGSAISALENLFAGD